MISPYLKPKADGRGKRPGRKDEHLGSRRPTPEVINHHADHRLPCCPDCHGPLTRTHQTRTRITEDIPEKITPVVTEHTIHREMSVYRTLQQRGHAPLKTVVDALTTYLATKELPPLPARVTADG